MSQCPSSSLVPWWSSPCRSWSALLNLNQVTSLSANVFQWLPNAHTVTFKLQHGFKGLILCLLIIQSHWFPKCGPCTISIPGNSLEMQFWGPRQIHWIRNFGVRPCNLSFNRPSRFGYCTGFFLFLRHSRLPSAWNALFQSCSCFVRPALFHYVHLFKSSFFIQKGCSQPPRLK